ncbi:sensor histidine kinase [Dysgonomonas macrotermitis]|uniref:GHKL domain-containing protein n=1 Tax=Dysgonomonas macrotermitis TaxID=1346286 RepID=A0A1M5AT77_9BACT|nr:histidine kinase [Dysgonomonas macrotermitis]SHF33297.1 GHKL domain-containing protein [Dysgonomonas macrotermitis]
MKYSYIKNYNGFFILIWVLIFAVLGVQYMESMNTFEGFLLATSIVVTAYPFTTYLSRRLLRRAMESKNMVKFIIQFFIFTLIYSALIPVIVYLFNQLETIGLFSPSEFMGRWNNSWNEFLNGLLTSLLINLSFCGLSFFEQNIRLQKELAESSLQILQAQINPHFMFNVLNHINILIRKEPELASSVLVQYTHILRYQLYNGRKDYVSINQEVEFLKDFIEVEKIRWKNSLDIKYLWEIEDFNVTIAPLMLITFVENAFKHVSRSKSDKGYVYIHLKEENREVALTVENSKYADNVIYEKKEESGIGLENIGKRLDILYHNRYKLVINDTEISYSIFLSIKL